MTPSPAARTEALEPATAYPGIYKASLEIAYDNGGINCDRPEARQRREFNRFMKRHGTHTPNLKEIDGWLAALTEDELQQVCAGEETETIQFMKDRRAPVFTQDLLNQIFEKVC